MKWPKPTRLAGIILAIAAALALSACSTVKLGYSTLPNVVWWWLDSYVDFDDQQESRVQDEIAALHAWHRKQELPRLVDLLFRMEQIAPGEITGPQACAIVAEVQQRGRALWERAESGVATIAIGLHQRQLRHLARKYRSNEERYRKEWLALPRPEQEEKRFKQLLERMEMLYGSLDEPQQAVLRQRIAATMWDPERIHAEWQRRKQEQLQMLGRIARPGTTTAEARLQLRAWFDQLQKPSAAAYGAYQQALLDENCATFAAVHQSTTAAQRDHAMRRLRGWQRDLRDLVTQP